MFSQNSLDGRVFSGTFVLVARIWRSWIDRALVDDGHSYASSFPLIAIHRLGNGMRQNALASALGIEGPSLVRSLDVLATAGLLERREDPGDKRAKTIHLTPEGESLVRRMEPRLTQLRATLLAGIPNEDLAAATRVLQAIAANAGVNILAPIALADTKVNGAAPGDNATP